MPSLKKTKKHKPDYKKIFKLKWATLPMKKWAFWKGLESVKTYQRVSFFILVVILTVIITRISVLIVNIDPTILSFELHHFDYGLFLLILASLLFLFGKWRYKTYLILTGISIGLIIDGLWFIRSNINEPEIEETAIYFATLPSVAILFIIILLIVFLIKSFFKRERKL